MGKAKRNINIPKAKEPDQLANKGKLYSYSQNEKIKGINEDNVVFSWKFFDRKHELFNCGATESGWFISLFDILYQVSDMAYIEFRQQRNKGLRVHPHDWKDTTAKFDLDDNLLEQLEEDNACIQFSVSQAKGRVHGFMIDNIFYIVWLDRHHNLYPSENHGGIKKYQAPFTPFEQLEEDMRLYQVENAKLKEEIDAYEKLLEEY
ncbi:hypothetical protein BN997_01141 [Oceanobacillus oncorhynchi]|uniref:Uncharacterized protein n=1 Tax=Oceanobacillus oncorhynchi TaxID=545501 RepID=A0A0A1ME52_9BACI|nr:hypothetical protein [Oceanobacillus oncorhynchi]CEI81323.1 hypothetical protein BN997_01141 [Oceanobacillus oncorhynchi]